MHLLPDIGQDASEIRKADLIDEGSVGRWFSPLDHYALSKLENALAS